MSVLYNGIILEGFADRVKKENEERKEKSKNFTYDKLAGKDELNASFAKDAERRAHDKKYYVPNPESDIDVSEPYDYQGDDAMPRHLQNKIPNYKEKEIPEYSVVTPRTVSGKPYVEPKVKSNQGGTDSTESPETIDVNDMPVYKESPEDLYIPRADEEVPDRKFNDLGPGTYRDLKTKSGDNQVKFIDLNNDKFAFINKNGVRLYKDSFERNDGAVPSYFFFNKFLCIKDGKDEAGDAWSIYAPASHGKQWMTFKDIKQNKNFDTITCVTDKDEYYVINNHGENYLDDKLQSTIAHNKYIIGDEIVRKTNNVEEDTILPVTKPGEDKPFGYINFKGELKIGDVEENTIIDINISLVHPKKNSKTGKFEFYVTNKDGDERPYTLIQDSFDKAYPFSEGSSLVKKDDKYYFIDVHGKKVDTVEDSFVYALNIKKDSGSLCVCEDGRYYVLTQKSNSDDKPEIDVEFESDKNVFAVLKKTGSVDGSFYPKKDGNGVVEKCGFVVYKKEKDGIKFGVSVFDGEKIEDQVIPIKYNTVSLLSNFVIEGNGKEKKKMRITDDYKVEEIKAEPVKENKIPSFLDFINRNK